MAPMATLAGSLSRSFSDPRLRQLFGRYATYVGGSPYASPALLALIWSAEARGVWRVEGGMHRLAQALAALAAARGGPNCATTAPPCGSRRRATGSLPCIWRAAPGWRPTGSSSTAIPRRCAAGCSALQCGQCRSDAVEPRSLSAHVWAFARECLGPRLAHHNVFFCADPRAEFEDLAAGRMPADPTLYVCAQDRGAGLPGGDGALRDHHERPPTRPGTRPRPKGGIRHAGHGFSTRSPASD
jgi:1-hydroxycarotenoid 3,4-desaturase